MMRSRGEQAVRLLKLCNILSGRVAKTRADLLDLLAEEGVNISDRTLIRDLEMIEQAGLWLDRVTTDDRRIAYRIKGAVRVDADLTVGELAALVFALKKVQSLRIPRFGANLQSVFDKLTAAMPPTLRKAAGDLYDAFDAYEQHPKDYSAPHEAEILAALVDAVRRREELHFVYTNFAQETKEYDVRPLRLAQYQGGLYVHVSLSENPDHVFMCAVERIRKATKTGASFHAEDLAEAYKKIEEGRRRAFGIMDDGRVRRYTIHVSKEMAAFISERRWHPTQKLRRKKDGTLVMQFEASGAVEVERWRRWLGDGVLDWKSEE